MWLFNILNKNIETNIDLPLEYVNLPEDEVATNAFPEILSATYIGQGWFLLRNRINLRESVVEIDLSNDLFENQIEEENLLEIINEAGPQNIKAIACRPAEILVQFEKKVEKKIPLLVPTTISFKQGYDIKETIKIIPDSVIASGPKSIIDTLNRWYTDTIKHNNLKASVNSKVNVKETLDNIVFSKYLIDYEIDVAQYTEKKLDVEIKVINKQNNKLLIVPKKVKLKCLVPINEYDNINADDFSLIADFKKERVKGYINLKLNKKAAFAKKISFFPKSVEYIKLNE